MLHTILNVVFVLVAVSMIVLILLQRGAGAQAGSGFGAGASATVFGARGSANFLSSATKWLAVVFFSLTLFMAWQASHEAAQKPDEDLGVMSQVPAESAPKTTPAPADVLPAAPASPNAGSAPAAAPSAAPIIAPAQNPAPAPAQTPPPGNKGG
jgi:preprotein translocase subunit SecG